MSKSVLVALDISGSINVKNAIKRGQELIRSMCPTAELYVKTFDMNVYDSSVLDLMQGNIQGGGGTSIQGVLDIADDYDTVMVVTDGYFEVQVPEHIELHIVE